MVVAEGLTFTVKVAGALPLNELPARLPVNEPLPVTFTTRAAEADAQMVVLLVLRFAAMAAF